MLEITVKTLDSQSRNFSVPDDITVQSFKQHISQTVNIPVERQRLIYQGRVLQDAVQLNASGDINGKVIHLVERLPTAHVQTPAETARSGPRVPGPPPRAATPRVPGLAGNIFGPFPVPAPGPNFNSNQFVQQMLQQALSGMSNPVGPTVVRGSVRHPHMSEGDMRTEIQIHIGPQGAQGSQSNQPNVNQEHRHPVQPAQQSTAQRRVQPQQNTAPQRPQEVLSEPRRQLNHVEYLLIKLEEHIVCLETGNFPESLGDNTNTSNTNLSDSTGTQNQASTSGTGSINSAAGQATSSEPNSTRHPSLPDVGHVLRRVTELETRFLPFLIEYTNFLEIDPAYSSTESAEYKRMMGFVTAVLKSQRALSVIHRIFSLLVIPLSETPPRSMLIQGECSRHRAPQGRRLHNVATAGQYLNQPRMGQVHQGGSIRMPMFLGPFRGTAPMNMRPGMIGMGPIPQSMLRFNSPPQHPMPQQGHQSGLYGHPTSQQTSFVGRHPVPVLEQTQPAASGPVQVSRSTTSSEPVSVAGGTTAPTNDSVVSQSSASSHGSTRVDIAPTDYAVQITTHIQPNININITPESTIGTTIQEGEIDGIVETSLEEGGDAGAHIDPAHSDSTQAFGFSSSMQADDQGNISIPQEMQLPSIPGLSQEAMRQIIQSVQGSVRQVMNVVTQNNGTMTGENTSQQHTERVSIQGLPGGTNQIPIEIANIIGQTVQNIMLNHLTNSEPNFQEDQATTGASTTSLSSGTTSVSTTASATITPTSSNTTPSVPTTSSNASSEQPVTENRLAELLAEIHRGHFGTIANQTSTSSESQPVGGTRERVVGQAGNTHRNLPKIQRTPNCVNDIVRGQGYMSEMCLTGNENIIELVLFYCGELLSIPDCIAFMAGASEPGNRLRGPLRRVLSERWFEGSVPNRDQIEAEVDRHSDELRPFIEEYFHNEQPKLQDVSVVESNLSLYRHVLRRLLHLLYIHDSQNFARDIHNHLINSLALALQLNVHILRGTEERVQQLVMRQLGAALDPFSTGATNQPNPMVEQVRTMMGNHLIPFIRNHSVNQDQIDQFVMNFPAEQEATLTNEATCSNITNTSNMDEKANKSEIAHDNQGTSESLLPMPSEKQEESEQPEKDSGDADVMEISEESSTEDLDGARDDVDWTTMVPEEWVSVITADIENQKNVVEQPPYSDAYSVGMPANKRRKV
ncbi:uncharacterized protein LOC144411618 [Styela clava]|uniref:large proline-rich protein BAG6-like n=1 Tax=Styela clava TaxID=7725 RepID=UPI00193A7AF6|nr:large proline-rich protein BAG6-like [Styela clava]XP_039274764.1 large proline-rich protein BAG6-like [Styela clava]XP_039274765.1 large proline-rich protein BAG6-like [Styela clava]XP_039274766.1 large proline-rich protein BAG6-like [Styela clava]